ncbi:MAG: substrate-binding domain-containing protein [Gammaproteobacteria bacterium]|nr:substrate-binding domain-containing protein [Gammaproteobacteria bacterium]
MARDLRPAPRATAAGFAAVRRGHGRRRTWAARLARSIAPAAAAAAVLLAFPLTPTAAERQLRVCSDPNNLPFSNRAGEGFENALAELIADELGAELSYTWWAQRRGFIRNTLDAGECDLVIGVPADYELVETTRPYYRSSYVFVYPAAEQLDLRSLGDPRLRKLRIGVHLTGDDGANPPPVHALGRLGIVDNVVGYMIYGDYRDPNPPARLIEAVANGEVDVATAWGPLAGWFAQRSDVPLEVQPIKDGAAFAPLPFEFSIAMGVRRGDTALRDEIEAVLESRRDDVVATLERYGVPLVEPRDGRAAEGAEPLRVAHDDVSEGQ